jgi:hypothetical protein
LAAVLRRGLISLTTLGRHTMRKAEKLSVKEKNSEEIELGDQESKLNAILV